MHLQIRATDYVYASIRGLVRSATFASEYTRLIEDSALVMEGETFNAKLAPDADVLRITRLQPISTLASSLALVEYPTSDTNEPWEGPWIDRFIVELGGSISSVTTLRIHGLNWVDNTPHEGVFGSASRFANVVELWLSDCQFFSLKSYKCFVKTFPSLDKLHVRDAYYLDLSLNGRTHSVSAYTPVSRVGDMSGRDLRVWLAQAN